MTQKWISYSPDARLLAASVAVTRRMQRLALPTADKIPVKRTTSPGRLMTGQAVHAASLRKTGNTSAAMKMPVFKAHRIDRTVAPPGVVGIMADVSGSMQWSTTAVGEAAWLLARGAAHSGATVASVVFGVDVDPIVFPGEVPQQVLVRSALDGQHAADRALAALEGALNLGQGTVGGTGIPRSRVVIILSDLIWSAERSPFLYRARRLAMQGVKFIAIGPRSERSKTHVNRATAGIAPDFGEWLGIDLVGDPSAMVSPWYAKPANGWQAEHVTPRAPSADEARMLRQAGLTAQPLMSVVPRPVVMADGSNAEDVRDAIVRIALDTLEKMEKSSG